jgi:hypothetical protein
MPEGTLFHKYQPCAMDNDGLGIFHGACGEDDFIAEYPMDHHSEGESRGVVVQDLDPTITPMGESVPVAFGGHIIRDAYHNPNQLFAVWEPSDIEIFIAYLRQLQAQAVVPTA